MRISDWSSDVCSSDLAYAQARHRRPPGLGLVLGYRAGPDRPARRHDLRPSARRRRSGARVRIPPRASRPLDRSDAGRDLERGGDRDTGTRRSGPGAHNLRRSTMPVEINELNATTRRSEEHTSELQSLMRISYAVFCLKKKTNY